MKKIKNSLPMEFNIALQKYEPKLKIIKKGKKINNFGWKLILILLGIMSMFFLLRYFLI